MSPVLETQFGKLYQQDCLEFLSSIEDGCVDLAFADPPFNLGKQYTSNIDDDLAEDQYLAWCKQWLDEMIRTVKPGGSLFVYNLPKWNLALGSYLMQRMTFRHWITVDMKFSLPVKGRLYPANYSLLYFVKGARPNIFHPDRLPVPCCKNCGQELRDYGGYKAKMNPLGVNLSDVWSDIPPVRHSKYKKRGANALALKLMDRIIAMASDPGSLIMDPFGGSGTTYVAAELTGRKWLGCELDCEPILGRFDALDGDRDHIREIHSKKNRLFTKSDIAKRIEVGRPLSDQYRLLDEPDDKPRCVTCDESQADLFKN